MPMRPPDLDVSSWIILIIDDSPDNIGVAKTVFTYFGAKVYVATNGEEGLLMLQNIKPTVVLLDISMPVMNGWETLEKIRKDPVLGKIVVIALTAHAMKGDRDKAMVAGFDGYISKPFQILELVKQVKNIVNGVEQPPTGASS